MIAKIFGWALLGIGIFYLFGTAWLDRCLQRFRSPGMPSAAYLGKFARWRRDLYTADSWPLIGPTRRPFALFCIASLLGAFVLANAPG